MVIRCESDGCSTGFDIDVLEMDYKEYVVTGLDGSSFQCSCTPDDSDDLSCLNILSGTSVGYRKFHCETDLAARDINGQDCPALEAT